MKMPTKKRTTRTGKPIVKRKLGPTTSELTQRKRDEKTQVLIDILRSAYEKKKAIDALSEEFGAQRKQAMELFDELDIRKMEFHGPNGEDVSVTYTPDATSLVVDLKVLKAILPESVYKQIIKEAVDLESLKHLMAKGVIDPIEAKKKKGIYEQPRAPYISFR